MCAGTRNVKEQLELLLILPTPIREKTTESRQTKLMLVRDSRKWARALTRWQCELVARTGPGISASTNHHPLHPRREFRLKHTAVKPPIIGGVSHRLDWLAIMSHPHRDRIFPSVMTVQLHYQPLTNQDRLQTLECFISRVRVEGYRADVYITWLRHWTAEPHYTPGWVRKAIPGILHTSQLHQITPMHLERL